MKQIIIDSGSTKSDVAIIDDGKATCFKHPGLNPSISSSIEFLPSLIEHIQGSEEIYFYGAGVIQEEHVMNITRALKEYNVAVNVHVHSDLLGACRAVLKHEAGIVCILGTGSNSCYYDGDEVSINIPALGYILGDEGGAAKIGSDIIKQYFRGTMPKKVRKVFEQQYRPELSNVIHQVYRQPRPNSYLASYAAFLDDIKGQWKKDLLNHHFDQFIHERILPYGMTPDVPIHFIGSVAFHNKKRLAKRLKKVGLRLAGVEQYPIKKLIKYHQNNNHRV